MEEAGKLPWDEVIKKGLCSKFNTTEKYTGKSVVHIISHTSLEKMMDISLINPEDVKVGDVFWIKDFKNKRPAVVISVHKKEGYCKVIKLTSTDNVHNTQIPTNSRFVQNSFYAYGFDVVRIDMVARHFFYHTEDKKSLRLAIKKNKEFFI